MNIDAIYAFKHLSVTVAKTCIARQYYFIVLTADFLSTNLLMDLKMMLLFCWHVLQRSLNGHPITICGSSARQ